uniref:Uncharacterized protein n=1 Tax=Paramoeba aestuarina TaxID=180227 RepID=A0A7S4KAR6_9EUKA|mmetsp:Transcript_16668/g.25934  ORF Transcript_16668/g.25934 Transcript_16668/m.25934 type:complete len:240 (+) Transcript_16668:122-841(+)|eukprot:CAMPEP_0201539574 /NCGR_PEP_ID=MMETSP0161_2-20130828/70478_1 /ASSEMBLY_ACC=CAM_ASM_000251 /TAXON_ID=180227 /ORGANISM="Neoparamoeba aestuarina, Strain SoJaBio B1-5/56/2" /LENGTH=239 /DNA_ID=CAMNT_0047946981 /DNA_START=509 /DNA_END=1228 /DNA_ORIENTATION=-
MADPDAGLTNFKWMMKIEEKTVYIQATDQANNKVYHHCFSVDDCHKRTASLFDNAEVFVRKVTPLVVNNATTPQLQLEKVRRENGIELVFSETLTEKTFRLLLTPTNDDVGIGRAKGKRAKHFHSLTDAGKGMEEDINAFLNNNRGNVVVHKAIPAFTSHGTSSYLYRTVLIYEELPTSYTYGYEVFFGSGQYGSISTGKLDDWLCGQPSDVEIVSLDAVALPNAWYGWTMVLWKKFGV